MQREVGAGTWLGAGAAMRLCLSLQRSGGAAARRRRPAAEGAVISVSLSKILSTLPCRGCGSTSRGTVIPRGGLTTYGSHMLLCRPPPDVWRKVGLAVLVAAAAGAVVVQNPNGFATAMKVSLGVLGSDRIYRMYILNSYIDHFLGCRNLLISLLIGDA